MTEQTEKITKKKKIKKGVMIALIVLCVLICIAVVACIIQIEQLLGLINRADDEILETMSDAQYQEMMEAMRETSRCLRCDHFGYGNFRGGRDRAW